MTNPNDDPDITMLPESACPTCGYVMTAAGPTPNSMTGIRPDVGDPILCMKCAAINTLRADRTLRTMEPWEFQQLHPETRQFVKSERRQLLKFIASQRGRNN